MLPPNRRQALKRFLGGFVQTMGTVVLAQTCLPATAGAEETKGPADTDLEERANQAARESSSGEEDLEQCSFANGGFRNGGGGGFRKGGFANGGGGFRKGGFANGGGGGFRNG